MQTITNQLAYRIASQPISKELGYILTTELEDERNREWPRLKGYPNPYPIKKGLQYEVLPKKESKQDRDSTAIYKELFLRTLERTRGVITVCCDKVGISRATYYVWMKNDPEFKSAVEEVLKLKADFLEEIMYVMATKDFRATKYMLEKIHPEFKKNPKENKETIVNIYHHATPPEEKEEGELNVSFYQLIALAEGRDPELLEPTAQKFVKRYKPIADFLKKHYSWINEKEELDDPASAKNSETSKNA